MEQSRNRRLLKNTFIISIGKLGTSAVSFLLLPLYTKVLTPGEYGIHDLLGTIQTILGICFGLQLANCIYRFLIESRQNQENIKKIISNVLFINFFIFHNIFNFQASILLVFTCTCSCVQFFCTFTRYIKRIRQIWGVCPLWIYSNAYFINK